MWTAFGPVPIADGPVVVVEGSHRFADLVEATRAEDHFSFARSRGARLLSADFGPGDIVMFGMFTWHGALDNHSACGCRRMSASNPSASPRTRAIAAPTQAARRAPATANSTAPSH